MRLYPSHVFSRNGCTYLINPGRMVSGRVLPELIRLKKAIEDTPDYCVSSSESDLLNEFEMIRPENESRKKPLVYGGDIRDLSLMIAQKCNLNCVYCFGDGGTYGHESGMNRETAVKAIDWLIDTSRKSGHLSLSFFGGEPLLNFRVIRSAIEYAEEQGRRKGKTFFFTLVTNGTLLTRETVDYLNRHEVMVKVSIDGDRETHDRQRPFRNGQGTHKKILGNLTSLLDVQPLAACRATILGQTSPLGVRKAIQDLGFRRIEIQMATPFKNSQGDDGCRQRNTEGMIDLADVLAEDLLAFTKERDSDRVRALWKSSELGAKVLLFMRRKKLHFFCGAGNYSAAVDVDGDIYLCPSFVGDKRYRIGSIRNGEPIAQTYRKSQLARQDDCQYCFARYTCGGRCYYDNLAMTGSIFDPPEDMCALERHRAELAAYINGEFCEDDVQFLEQSRIIPPAPWYDNLF